MPPSELSGSTDPADLEPIGGFLYPAKWRIQFEDVRAAGRCTDVFLYAHYLSRWMVVTDLEGDILGGRYLDADEKITEGTRLLIDVFDVCVGNFMQGEPKVRDQIEVVDLTADPEPSKLRFGGHFWVLTDEEDDDAEGELLIICPEEKPRMRPAKPEHATSLQMRIGGRRKKEVVFGPRSPLAPPKVKPWRGPLPKVSSSAITLSDLFPPDVWTRVTRKKKKKCAPAVIRSSTVNGEARQIRAAR